MFSSSSGAAIVADSADLNPLQVAVNNGSFETLMSLLQYISAASGGLSDEATHILQWSAANNKADILRKVTYKHIKYTKHKLHDHVRVGTFPSLDNYFLE